MRALQAPGHFFEGHLGLLGPIDGVVAPLNHSPLLGEPLLLGPAHLALAGRLLLGLRDGPLLDLGPPVLLLLPGRRGGRKRRKIILPILEEGSSKFLSGQLRILGEHSEGGGSNRGSSVNNLLTA